MNKTAIEKMYAEKKKYVEVTLADMLKPLNDFGCIQYARDVRSGEEYVKVTEANGFPWFICVTGNSLSAIGKEVCRMVDINTTLTYVYTSEEKIRTSYLKFSA